MLKVREPETVAGHMFRMGMMGLLFSYTEPDHGPASSGLTVDACIISLVHDMAECIIGDITPHCNVSPTLLFQREANVNRISVRYDS